MKTLITIGVIAGLLGSIHLQSNRIELLTTELSLAKSRLEILEADLVDVNTHRDKVEDKLIATRSELKKMTKYRNLCAEDSEHIEKRYWACEERLLVR
jgi:predicted  nucleic acid-binding Zn-ribbon protein